MMRKLTLDEAVYLAVGELVKNKGYIFLYGDLYDEVERLAKEEKLLKLHSLSHISVSINKFENAGIFYVYRVVGRILLTRKTEIHVKNYKFVNEIVEEKRRELKKLERGLSLFDKKRWKHRDMENKAMEIIEYLKTKGTTILGFPIIPAVEIAKKMKIDRSLLYNYILKRARMIDDSIVLFTFPVSERLWIWYGDASSFRY